MDAEIKFKYLEGGLGELVISQPSRRNALNAKMWADIPKVLDGAKAHSNLKVLIVRGDGDHFASGADISEFETLYATLESAEDISKRISTGMNALAHFPLPTIAMIRGACIGGGCALALSCDIRMADTTSKFAITPAKLGLNYPFGDVQRLIETVGISNAKDMLFSARLLQSADAKAMGLINSLHSVDDLQDRVATYAHGIEALSVQSAKITKQFFARYQTGQRGDNAETEASFLSGFLSEDFKEGYHAFLEKRKPNF